MNASAVWSLSFVRTFWEWLSSTPRLTPAHGWLLPAPVPWPAQAALAPGCSTSHARHRS